MRVLLINSVCGIRSTGRICTDIANALSGEGHEVKIAYGRETVPEKYQKYAVKIGNGTDQKLHGVLTRAFDKHGFGSKKATADFLEWAEKYDPDILWLHNIHGYYINIEMLFGWIKSRPDMQVKWTLHDCWAFTGHCSHFAFAKCNKWKEHCENCPQKGTYPTSLFKDNSYDNFERKKAAFTGVKNMTLITPSKWLADLVSESFLGEYPIEVKYNTIDTSVFKPTPSDFRKKYGLEDKKIILGVASAWGERKGLYDFIKLSSMLDENYAVVLVGLSEKQLKELPEGVIGIKQTNSARELAEIYTAADVFFNPTYEDNYPTTNLEAQACKTPCVTYRTGGSVESVPAENVIEQGDLEAFIALLSSDLSVNEISGGGNK